MENIGFYDDLALLQYQIETVELFILTVDAKILVFMSTTLENYVTYSELLA